MIGNNCIKAADGIALCKVTICNEIVSVQRQTYVKIHMSYVIYFLHMKVRTMI